MEEAENDQTHFVCSQNNSCIFVCASENCYISSPFVCSTPLCQCVIQHHRCKFKNYQFLRRRINQNQEEHRSLFEKINNQVEALSQKIAELKIQIYKIFQSYIGGPLQEFRQRLSSMKYEKINGDFIRKVCNQIQTQNSISILNTKEKLVQISQIQGKIYSDFEYLSQISYKSTKSEASKIRSLVPISKQEMEISAVINQASFQISEYMYWSQNLKSKSIVIRDQIVEQTNPDVDLQNGRFILLEPAINSVCTFGIEILNQGSEVYVGIGLRKILEKNSFGFNDFYNVGHGMYLFGSLGAIYSHHQSQYNNRISQGDFRFYKNYQIFTKVDLILGRINYFKIQNKRIKHVYELNVKYLQNDIVHGLVYLKGQGASVKLIKMSRHNQQQIIKQEEELSQQ